MLVKYRHRLLNLLFIACEDVQVQNSASQCRVSFQLTQNSFIPAAFKIERRIAAGSWVEIESAYTMPNPFTGYKFSGINRNFYYVDSGLTTAGTYQYRINSTYLSNTVTKTGTTYYVKNGGSDGANGLTDGTAWATMAHANSTATSPGDLVYFKKGGTWAENINFNDSGTDDNPVTWSSYDSGNLPILQGTASYGLYVTDVSYRNFEFVEFSGNASGKQAIILFGSYTNGVMTTDNKILNCEIDVTNATGGAGGGFFCFNGDTGVPSSQTANYNLTHHIEYPEIAYCYIHGTAQRSSVRSHDVRKGAWYHNNFIDQGSAALTVSGGDDHCVEYNEMVGGTYATHAGAGTKANSQIYYLNGMIYRRNLVYYMQDYCMSLQSSADALVEYNTCYDNGTTYATFWCLTDEDTCETHWANGGNIVRNNIFMGGKSTQGAIRIEISALEAGGGNWYDHIDFYDHCIYEGAGGIIELDSPDSKINTHALFLSNWNDKYPDDIHEDPQFNGVSTGDFTTNNSNCDNKGCFAA